MILNEYQKHTKLTDCELETFALLYDLANVMGILQIGYLKSKGKMSDEDAFWLSVSENGLKFSDKSFWEAIFG